MSINLTKQWIATERWFDTRFLDSVTRILTKTVKVVTYSTIRV